jgi:hypothetical protein
LTPWTAIAHVWMGAYKKDLVKNIKVKKALLLNIEQPHLLVGPA